MSCTRSLASTGRAPRDGGTDDGSTGLTRGFALAGAATAAGARRSLAGGVPAAVARGAAPVPTPATARDPRPLSTARSSAAVGRSAALGERHRCRAALTSAFVAGAGIEPARVGGLAADARTRLAYSA